MRSTLPLELHGYCRNSLRAQYGQDDHSANVIEVCEGASRLIELYPDGHAERRIRLTYAFHSIDLGSISIQERMTVHRLTAVWQLKK